MLSDDEAIILLLAHPENRCLGTTFRLRPGSVVDIGRGADCEISFPEVLSISRHNTRVENAGEHVWIEDLGSTNGTAVNDELIGDRCELRSGDRFQVGAVHFKFLRSDDVEYVYHRTMGALIDDSWKVGTTTGTTPPPPQGETSPEATAEWRNSPSLGHSRGSTNYKAVLAQKPGRLSEILGCLFPLALVALPIAIAVVDDQLGRSSGDEVAPHQGDAAKSGGSASVRSAYVPLPDDPETTNDESNDQPLGHFGTTTLTVFSDESGNYYTLDGDIDDGQLARLYFPRGGWVDFFDCELDDELHGTCFDEEGRSWEIEGE